MRTRRLKNEINVVPYIDVMLVLLVIFMVAAPMMSTGNVELPTVGKASQTPTQPVQIDIKADMSLEVRDQAKNEPAKPMSKQEMLAFVKAAQAGSPDKAVVIAGDKNVKYEAVLGVMDELQRAQIKRVGLLVQPTGK